jgi:Flp pilus assembly protein TadG
MVTLKLISGSRRHCRGLAIIEAALVMPLLILILFGLIEYGWMFLKYQQIGAAARQGARIGITQSATNGTVTAAVDTIMNTAGLASSGYTTTFAPGDVAAMFAGETLTVTVAVPYANVGLTGFPLPVPTTLTGRVSMAKEGAP